jgi:hypothetical protein
MRSGGACEARNYNDGSIVLALLCENALFEFHPKIRPDLVQRPANV